MSMNPLIDPCWSMASIAYCEHVGKYLQVAGINGEINFW